MYTIPPMPRTRRRRWSLVWVGSTTLLSALCLLAWGLALANGVRYGGPRADSILMMLALGGYGGVVAARGWWFWQARRGRDRPGWRRLASFLYWGASILIGAGWVASMVYCGC